MLNKILSVKLLLVLIIAIAFILRFYNLNFSPPSLNWDEVSHGYNAYSILKTGKDEWGVSFPTIFRAYGDYKLPVYIYLVSISEFFLGFNETAVRLPSVLAGTLTVLFTYLLTKRLLKNSTLSLIASALIAIEPWNLFLSRIAVEANLSLFFIISGIYFFLVGRERPKYFILSTILLGLSVWTYNSARIFVPIFIIFLFFIYKDQLKIIWENSKKISICCFLVAAVFFVPMFMQLANTSGSARYGWVKILDEGAIDQIIELRNASSLPNFIERAIFNRPVYFLISFAKNYISHFSPQFLFLAGGSHYQFSIPGFGLMHIVNLPFFVFGLFLIVKRIKTKESKIILSWLLLAPVASSLTREAPHALRSIVMMPIPMIISGVGVSSFFNFLKNKFNKTIFAVAAILYIFVFGSLIGNYIQSLFSDYRRDYSWSWQYGYKDAVGYVRENYDKYDKIIFTKKYGEPHEFLLFYLQWDPGNYYNNPSLIRFAQSDWFWIDRFDKFFFVNDWEIPHNKNIFVLESKQDVDCRQVKCLLVTSPDNFPNGWYRVDEVKFLDGKQAFEMYEN